MSDIWSLHAKCVQFGDVVLSDGDITTNYFAQKTVMVVIDAILGVEHVLTKTEHILWTDVNVLI